MGKKLYVGNLSYSVKEEHLKDKFSEFGTVESAKVITDRDTGRSKGFGFVEMSSDEEAGKAIDSMDGQEFEGRNIRVNEAKPQEPKKQGGFGGNRGGRY